jgi:type VI secretion system ImpH/TssG family protein
MNDMTLALNFEPDSRHPFAAVFAIEQELFKSQQSKILDALEKGVIKFQYKQSFDPHEALIQSVQRSEDSRQFIVTGSLLNLTGANGILPGHYSETIARSLRDKSTVFKDFLDIFNHRANSLMYRSWAKYRLDTDKAYQSNVDQYQSTIDLMMSVFAGGTFPHTDASSLYFSGLTYTTTKSAQKLKNIINDLTGLEVDINEFKGKWIELSDDQLSRMKSKKHGDCFNQLGVNSMLGRRCWDLSSGFEIEFDVNDAETFAKLTPGGKTHELLKQTITKLVGNSFEFNFKLKVKEAHCQPVQLKKDSKTAKLGANAWMGENTSYERVVNYYC